MFLFFVSLTGLVSSLAAQPLIPSYLMKSSTGSGGGSGSSRTVSEKHVSLNQTIAQSSLTGKFQTGKLVLLQGFQHALRERPNQKPDEEPLSVTIFPNPSDGRITIQLPAKLVGSQIMIRLSNFTGQLLCEATLPVRQTAIPVDFSDLPKAPYIIAIRNTNSSWNRSVVIFK